MSPGATTKLDNVDDVYPLTHMQGGMLYHDIADPGAGLFTNHIVVDLEGHLDIERFRAAWSALSRRHAVLRTAFVWDGLDAPLQVVRSGVDVPLALEDWRGQTDDQTEARTQKLVATSAREGFDLKSAPLTRHTLIHTGDQRWRWVWAFHHMVLDGWSAHLLLREVLASCGDATHDSAGGEPPAYGDFVSWLSGRDTDSFEPMWRQALEGLSPAKLEQPLETKPSSDGRYMHRADLPEELTKQCAGFAAEQRVTVNTVFLGAWLIVLSRWLLSDDVVVGVTSSGRPMELAGIEHAVGMFIDTQPLRMAVNPAMSVRDWLGDVQRRQLGLHALQHTPLVDVQRWAGGGGSEPLFDSIFVFENYPGLGGALQAEGLRVSGLRFIERSNYPLAVLVEPAETGAVTFVYDPERFDEGFVAGLGERYLRALSSLVDSPDGLVGEISLADPSTSGSGAVCAAGPDLPQPDPGLPETMGAWLRQVAAEVPDKTAVKSAEGSMTYAQLMSESESLAAALLHAGVTPGQPIGLLVPRSAEMVVGILGIMLAGGAYAPLDPAHPPGYRERMLGRAGITTVVTTASSPPELPATVRRVLIGQAQPRAADQPAGPIVPTDADQPAYMIHTSGSTGEPKGVLVSHANLIASTRARMAFYKQRVDRYLLLSPYTFDSSVAGLFWTLCCGGTLVLPGHDQERDTDRLRKLIRQEGVTHLLALPTLYDLLLDESEAEELGSIRIAIVAGEPCRPTLPEKHRRVVPEAELYNEYGPTEATVWSTACRIDSASHGEVSIGRPIPGTRVYLLDQAQQPVPRGAAGEIYIAGPGVALGYHRQHELTDQAFVDIDIAGRRERLYRTGDLACMNEAGELMFLGRRDSQLKVRGHRIESAAVESALLTAVGAKQAVVFKDKAGTRLLAAVVSDASGEFDERNARDALADQVPAPMVPDRIIAVDAIPTLSNGKVDYFGLLKAVSSEAIGASDHIEPRDEIERQLADIWSALLGRQRIGVHEDYFALGGDSIMSIRMVSRARQAGLRIEPRDIADHPTIAGLAARHRDQGSVPEPAGPVVGEVPLGPIQRWFLSLGLAHPDQWNQSMLFELSPGIDAEALREALQEVVDAHDMLRARFQRTGSDWIQVIEAERRVPAIETYAADEEGDRASAIEKTQQGLDLSQGPLIRAAILSRPSGETAQLLVAAHHLVVDAVSWSVLAQDLEHCYRNQLAQKKVPLPARTASARAWYGHLEEAAFEGERGYWMEALSETTGVLPAVGVAEGAEADLACVTVKMDSESSASLLGPANEAFGTRAQDLLVAGLFLAMRDWAGQDTVPILLESHGRPDDVDGLDLSRTVGWLTAVYPVLLGCDDSEDPAGVIKSIKQRLHSVPSGGLGYGVLRHMQRDPALTSIKEPPVLFNYLGRAEESSSGLIRPLGPVYQSARDPGGRRPHPIEVIASVNGGQLKFDWIYADGLVDRGRVQRAADDMIQHLNRLIAHCLGEGVSGFTPSDFPELDVDQGELDRFLEDLQQ